MSHSSKLSPTQSAESLEAADAWAESLTPEILAAYITDEDDENNSSANENEHVSSVNEDDDEAHIEKDANELNDTNKKPNANNSCAPSVRVRGSSSAVTAEESNPVRKISMQRTVSMPADTVDPKDLVRGATEFVASQLQAITTEMNSFGSAFWDRRCPIDLREALKFVVDSDCIGSDQRHTFRQLQKTLHEYAHFAHLRQNKVRRAESDATCIRSLKRAWKFMMSWVGREPTKTVWVHGVQKAVWQHVMLNEVREASEQASIVLRQYVASNLFQAQKEFYESTTSYDLRWLVKGICGRDNTLIRLLNNVAHLSYMTCNADQARDDILRLLSLLRGIPDTVNNSKDKRSTRAAIRKYFDGFGVPCVIQNPRAQLRAHFAIKLRKQRSQQILYARQRTAKTNRRSDRVEWGDELSEFGTARMKRNMQANW